MTPLIAPVGALWHLVDSNAASSFNERYQRFLFRSTPGAFTTAAVGTFNPAPHDVDKHIASLPETDIDTDGGVCDEYYDDGIQNYMRSAADTQSASSGHPDDTDADSASSHSTVSTESDEPDESEHVTNFKGAGFD